jgi:hypothetical protein
LVPGGRGSNRTIPLTAITRPAKVLIIVLSEIFVRRGLKRNSIFLTNLLAAKNIFATKLPSMLLSAITFGNQIGLPMAMARPESAIRPPSKIDSPGTGIGSKKGIEKINTTKA